MKTARSLHLSVLFLLLAMIPVRGQTPATVLQGGTLIDVVAGTRVNDAVVVMARDRILAVGKRGQVTVPTDARVVDVAGKYLIPGLIDCHIHYRDWVGEILLANGITSVLDQANPTTWSLAMKEAQQKGKVRAPRFYVTGNPLDASDDDAYFQEHGYMDAWISGGPTDVPPAARKVKYLDSRYTTYLDDPDEARQEVRSLLKSGVDSIKVYHKLAPDVLRAITDEAHRAGVSVVGHHLDAREAAEMGLDMIEHTQPIAISTITDAGKRQELKDGKLLNPHPYMDPARFRELARVLAKEDVYFNPTLSNSWKGLNPKTKQFRAEWEELVAKPALQYVPSNYRTQYRHNFDFLDRIGEKERAVLLSGYRNVERFMKQFVDEGGKLVAGADAAHGGIPGLGLHQEMELMVDAGITPLEALRSATLYSAQLMRKEKDLGALQAGKLADVVVLGADPLDRIRNTRTIEMVFMNGQAIDTSFHADYRIPISRAVPDTMDRDVSPVLDNVVPNVATEGDGDLIIELAGRFWPASKATFNGVTLQTTFVNGTRLKATIPSSQLRQVGTYAVQVQEPLGDRNVQSGRVMFVVKYR